MCWYSSLFILDPSKQLLQTCGRHITETADGELRVIDWRSPSRSEGYNPLDPEWSKEPADYLKISKMLVSASLGNGGKDPIWNLASESLIYFAIRYIVGHTEKQFRNLFQVYHFLSAMAANCDAVDIMIAETSDAELLAEYRAFLSYGRMLNSIIATSRAALSIFGLDPDIAKITSHNTLRVNDLRERRVSVFINTSTGEIQYYAALTSLLLQQVFGEIMKELPPTDSNYISFILDEASSLKFDLQVVSSNIRKFRCTLLHAYQSAQSQLTDLYGVAAAKAIVENCYTKVYMGGGMTQQVASELEATLGKFEFETEHGTKTRPLLTASDIRESKKALILIGNNRAIHTKVMPFFKQSKLVKMTEGEPFVAPERYDVKAPQLLNYGR